MSGHLKPNDWDLNINSNGELTVSGVSTVELAKLYDTPLHIVNVERLRQTIKLFQESFKRNYPSKCSIHFAFKANTVPGNLATIKEEGLKAEIMSDFELELALKLGYTGEEIIVNGPYKPIEFLAKCIENEVKLIIIDSLEELEMLDQISKEKNVDVNILIRINPDFIPRGMNYGTATASRKGCAFGLDRKGGEIEQALAKIGKMEKIHFQGYHFHIGSGILNPRDYLKAIMLLRPVIEFTIKKGFQLNVFDIGGGIGSPTTREMTTFEMLYYQGFDRLPKLKHSKHQVTFNEFASTISHGIKNLFNHKKLPELIIEPGRCIISQNQFLLLTVHGKKDRPGIKKWLITDGGIGTVTMPTYYECHQIFLCNDVDRPKKENVTIIGPVCFAGDIVYRNISMPETKIGEVIAIMDSGAYFNSWETSFSFPKSALVAVEKGRHMLIRRREMFEDLIKRDYMDL